MSFVLMYGLWQGLDGRVTLIFAISIIVAEVFVYMRWRLSVRCPHCHFDPLLYKSNRPKLVQQVNERLSGLRASGKYLLRHNNPFENLPTRPPTEKEKQQEKTSGLKRSKERLISKQV
jgi:glutaredoxin